jgi:hypothetical protein
VALKSTSSGMRGEKYLWLYEDRNVVKPFFAVRARREHGHATCVESRVVSP